MSQHEGVSCDSCLKNNFRGKRYKCLICFDYDLCAACHDSGAISARHTTDHPMQCILTRNDLDLYFAGELVEQPHSFTCPFCGTLGFTDSSLYEHVNGSHTDTSAEVVCPICATIPGGEPNQITDDFLTHLNVEHRNSRELEEPQIVRIRSRHHVRGLNNNRNRRSQYISSNGGGSSTVSRDAIDPISQLLSHWSDVRRVNANNNASGGQNGMMPFQFDRPVASNRIPLERLIRRHQQSSQISSSLGSANSESLTNQMPYMVQLDSTASPSVNANLLPKSASASAGSGSAGSQINKIHAKYLLSSTPASAPLAETEREKLGTLKADRSIFVQEMIIASLSEPLSIDSILSTKPMIELEDAKFSSNNQNVEQSNSEIKMHNESFDEIQVNGKATDGMGPSDMNSQTDEKLKKKSDDGKSLSAMKQSIKCNLESGNRNLSSSISYSEHESVPPKSLSSLNSSFIMSQAQLNHRSRANKGRSNSGINSSGNLTSLAIRSSLSPRPTTITVVSPTGRRKVLKHSTAEPPPN